MTSRTGTVRGRAAATGGFTLVELLVILSIILLLIAILVPVTERTQEVAKRVKCLTHLKEQYKAAMTFATDHKRRLCKLKGGGKSYNDTLRPYVGSPTVYHCPAEKSRSNKGANKLRLDFGINHYGYADNSTGRYLPTLHQQWLQAIGDMSCIYLADAETDSSPEDIGGISRGTWEWPIQYSFQRYAYKRHLGGYNAVRLNGEAEFFPDAWEVPYNEEWFIKKW